MAAHAAAQVNVQLITKALNGSDVRSLVAIGEKAVPPGLQSSYAVNTIAYADGQVKYRVESLLIRADVTQMQRSYLSGTSFQITSVEIKEDRLELKLMPRTEGGVAG